MQDTLTTKGDVVQGTCHVQHMWREGAGDAADNIKGVPGYGKVRATKLLQQWGSLENIFAYSSLMVRPAFSAGCFCVRPAFSAGLLVLLLDGAPFFLCCFFVLPLLLDWCCNHQDAASQPAQPAWKAPAALLVPPAVAHRSHPSSQRLNQTGTRCRHCNHPCTCAGQVQSERRLD